MLLYAGETIPFNDPKDKVQSGPSARPMADAVPPTSWSSQASAINLSHGGRPPFSLEVPGARAPVSTSNTIIAPTRNAVSFSHSKRRAPSQSYSAKKQKRASELEPSATTSIWIVPLPVQNLPGALPKLLKLAVEKCGLNKLFKWKSSDDSTTVAESAFEHITQGKHADDFNCMLRK
jgi:hypothetical protein